MLPALQRMSRASRPSAITPVGAPLRRRSGNDALSPRPAVKRCIRRRVVLDSLAAQGEKNARYRRERRGERTSFLDRLLCGGGRVSGIPTATTSTWSGKPVRSLSPKFQYRIRMLRPKSVRSHRFGAVRCRVPDLPHPILGKSHEAEKGSKGGSGACRGIRFE